MPFYKVKARVPGGTAIFNHVVNEAKVFEAAMEGRRVEPLVVQYEHGDTLELTEDQAKRHLATRMLEGPVEDPKVVAKREAAEKAAAEKAAADAAAAAK